MSSSLQADARRAAAAAISAARSSPARPQGCRRARSAQHPPHAASPSSIQRRRSAGVSRSKRGPARLTAFRRQPPRPRRQCAAKLARTKPEGNRVDRPQGKRVGAGSRSGPARSSARHRAACAARSARTSDPGGGWGGHRGARRAYRPGRLAAAAARLLEPRIQAHSALDDERGADRPDDRGERLGRCDHHRRRRPASADEAARSTRSSSSRARVARSPSGRAPGRGASWRRRGPGAGR